MYAVREGHVEVVQLLLEYELLDVLATNAVSILIYSYRSLVDLHNTYSYHFLPHRKARLCSTSQAATIKLSAFRRFTRN